MRGTSVVKGLAVFGEERNEVDEDSSSGDGVSGPIVNSELQHASIFNTAGIVEKNEGALTVRDAGSIFKGSPISRAPAFTSTAGSPWKERIRFTGKIEGGARTNLVENARVEHSKMTQAILGE